MENKVANSGLITLDLETLRPSGQRVKYDFKQNLFMEMVLKEKDFRAFLKSHDWAQYEGQNVAIICSADAIVPTWAYMLLAVYLEPYANFFIFGELDELETQLYFKTFESLDFEQYRNARVVIKGCSKESVPTAVFVELTKRLKPIVKSIMFGEPCSTVPLFKNKN